MIDSPAQCLVDAHVLAQQPVCPLTSTPTNLERLRPQLLRWLQRKTQSRRLLNRLLNEEFGPGGSQPLLASSPFMAALQMRLGNQVDLVDNPLKVLALAHTQPN